MSRDPVHSSCRVCESGGVTFTLSYFRYFRDDLLPRHTVNGEGRKELRLCFATGPALRLDEPCCGRCCRSFLVFNSFVISGGVYRQTRLHAREALAPNRVF